MEQSERNIMYLIDEQISCLEISRVLKLIPSIAYLVSSDVVTITELADSRIILVTSGKQ